MLRTHSRMIASIVMLTCGLVTAQAADTTLTLACEGTESSQGTFFTTKEQQEPKPVSMSIIVNLTRGTVQAFYFQLFFNDPIKILDMNELTLRFGAYEDGESTAGRIEGTIDRVTGDVNATLTTSVRSTTMAVRLVSYILKCRPAQRMF
jgi:hypothetical protein